MACESILKGLKAFDCMDAHGGTTGRVILLKYEDIDRTALTFEDGNVTAIGATGKGVEFIGGPNNANIGSFSFSQGAYGGGTYTHTVELRDFKGGAEAYNFLKGIRNATLVAIVETKYKGEAGECAYTIYGLESGLVLASDEGTTEMSDGVIATFSLATSENSPEPNRPINFFKTDLATTKQAIESLLPASTQTTPTEQTQE